MNARETDHFLPRTPDTKGIEVGEATFDEYTEARIRQEAALQPQQEVVEDMDDDHSGVITIRSVEEIKRMEGRMHVLRARIKSSNGSVPDNKKPVNRSESVHQQDSTEMRSEANRKGLFAKIKSIFR